MLQMTDKPYLLTYSRFNMYRLLLGDYHPVKGRVGVVGESHLFRHHKGDSERGLFLEMKEKTIN